MSESHVCSLPLSDLSAHIPSEGPLHTLHLRALPIEIILRETRQTTNALVLMLNRGKVKLELKVAL